LILEEGLKMSVRAKQPQFGNQESKTIDRKSIPSAGDFKNFTEQKKIHLFKDSSGCWAAAVMDFASIRGSWPSGPFTATVTVATSSHFT
jgi:hypothetical protein